ncbi:MAG: hypothetical protein M1812_008339 [Candelaria pacifica]|nr:MAG: hypothetical protein M1812_008339 [Candelaria pacifica]
MAEAIVSFDSDIMFIVQVSETSKTPQKTAIQTFVFRQEDTVEPELYDTPCKTKTLGEKRKIITTLSTDIKNNSRSSNTQTKSIKSNPGLCTEVENLDLFHQDRNSPLAKTRMCMKQALPMLNKQAKVELVNAILALDKAREAEKLESLQTSADEFSAIITKAQKTSLQSQFSEFKKNSDQKMNKMLQAIVSLSQKQLSDKTSKFTFFSSLSSTSVTSEADKNKSAKTAETFTKTIKLAEAVVYQTKVTYASKAAENTQQTDQAWSTVNKQKKTAPSFSKTAEKTVKVTARDRRLLIATTETKNFKPLYVRNQVNEAF